MAARLGKLQMQSFETWGGFVPTETIDKYWIGHYLGSDWVGGSAYAAKRKGGYSSRCAPQVPREE